ncbi:putative ankyrin repeat domain-containing protein 20A5 [Macaca nemestrina]|uniref:putative ankyrin repeat domain-containing protein 20A5 n=1 Tax=Macaca nemestrina TaxID=9545 RepID=UPI0003ABBDD0|nr:putative ankyrin repeat domain-containing protein 20A5 [Macaca fascicularis]XP_011713589.1 putative ankyrin repeat domain-containing protein 20A5 [Macaca nemestrina]XP_014984871.1 putative ankyrin repeat domain-containing protein 20A5 [Macaca mulatta]XP_050602460.1 putative ankyrin repeat domain-containing protein 20A5 [Macaca thibetana thibetana]
MKSFGFGSRRGQTVLSSIGHIYTGSRYRIWDAELQKIQRAAVKCDAGEVERCLVCWSGDQDKQHSSMSPRKCQSLYLDLPMKKKTE